MAPRSWRLIQAVAAGALALTACFDEPGDRSDLVFTDVLEPGVVYQPFLNSKLDAAGTDGTQAYAGSASLRISVPTPGEPGAGAFNFAGGAFTSGTARDLSGFTALTFWAKASRAVAFDSLGLFNDNTGTSRYQTEVNGLPLTTEWARFVIPIPAPARMTSERGLLWIAAGESVGYKAWFDEVRFEALDASGWNLRPAITAATRALGVSEPFDVAGAAVAYSAGGRDLTMSVYPATFDWHTSNPAVATVDERGRVTGVGPGTAVISASLGGVAAPQVVNVTVQAGLSPVAAPPSPTVPAAEVISLYSDAYTSHPVDKLAADWSNGCSNPICPRWSEVDLSGNLVSKYTDLIFTAIETLGPNLVDATAMTHVHVDVWTHDSTYFKLKLVDFGAGGTFGGGDDKEHELTYDAGSSPALGTGQWVSLDVPLTAFTGLTTRAHLAQVVFSASTATVFVDNVYFHR